MSDTPIKIKVYVVTTCNPGDAEPCLPYVFGTEDEATAHLEKTMRDLWEENPPHGDDDLLAPYPGNWRDAETILYVWNGGGRWEMTIHEVALPAVTALVHAARSARTVIEGRLKCLEMIDGQARTRATLPASYTAVDALKGSIETLEGKA